MLALKQLADYLTSDFLGGPKPWKFAWIINFQKGASLLVLLGLIIYYNNHSTSAYVYAALQGGYGFVWLLKDLAFPDPAWQRKITIASGFMAFFAVLFWYWVIGWLLISAPTPPAYPLPEAIWLGLCVLLCVFGVAIMVAADAQKYYTLRIQKGLITDGVHRYIRHPNYLGEIMIYAAFGLMAWHWLAAVILGLVWTLVFIPNMVAKERSLSRYPEWAAYKKRSGWLLPFL